MKSRIILVLAILFGAFGCNSGWQAPEDDRIIKMGPDVEAELVLFFKKGTSWQNILEFDRTVIGIPNKTGTGHSSLPGMMSVAKVEIAGYEGEAINFKPNATDEQKEVVKKRVLASPLVYKVYENARPNSIRDLYYSGDTPAPNRD